MKFNNAFNYVKNFQSNMLNVKKYFSAKVYKRKYKYITIEVIGNKKIKNIEFDNLDFDFVDLSDSLKKILNSTFDEIDNDIEKKVKKIVKS